MSLAGACPQVWDPSFCRCCPRGRTRITQLWQSQRKLHSFTSGWEAVSQGAGCSGRRGHQKCTKSCGTRRQDAWFKPWPQYQEFKAAPVKDPKAANYGQAALERDTEQPELWTPVRTLKALPQNFGHGPHGPHHLPAPSPSKYTGRCPLVTFCLRLLEKAPELLCHLWDMIRATFKVTGIFTCKEKNLQHVHLILSSSRHMWKEFFQIYIFNCNHSKSKTEN